MTNSKKKGSRGELEWSNFCKKHGYDTQRSVQYCGIKGDADVIGIDGFSMEVKRVEALQLGKAMDKAIEDTKDGEIPIVAHRKNYKPWLVTMLAEDWFKIIKEK